MKKLFVLYSSIRAKLRCFSFLQKNFFLMITIIGNVFGLLLNQLNWELVDSVCCQYEIMRYKSRINYSPRPGLAGQSHKTAGEVFVKTNALMIYFQAEHNTHLFLAMAAWQYSIQNNTKCCEK